jgi:hypothetical protein
MVIAPFGGEYQCLKTLLPVMFRMEAHFCSRMMPGADQLQELDGLICY